MEGTAEVPQPAAPAVQRPIPLHAGRPGRKSTKVFSNTQEELDYMTANLSRARGLLNPPAAVEDPDYEVVTNMEEVLTSASLMIFDPLHSNTWVHATPLQRRYWYLSATSARHVLQVIDRTTIAKNEKKVPVILCRIADEDRHLTGGKRVTAVAAPRQAKKLRQVPAQLLPRAEDQQ